VREFLRKLELGSLSGRRKVATGRFPDDLDRGISIGDVAEEEKAEREKRKSGRILTHEERIILQPEY